MFRGRCTSELFLKQEINTRERDKFWEKEEQEEKQRQAEEKNRKEEERTRIESERKQRE
ncbi:unnamed protein product, partial [Timema podura]|nr:unnamed protein product [Timema podura]